MNQNQLYILGKDEWMTNSIEKWLTVAGEDPNMLFATFRQQPIAITNLLPQLKNQAIQVPNVASTML